MQKNLLRTNNLMIWISHRIAQLCRNNYLCDSTFFHIFYSCIEGGNSCSITNNPAEVIRLSRIKSTPLDFITGFKRSSVITNRISFPINSNFISFHWTCAGAFFHNLILQTIVLLDEIRIICPRLKYIKS